MAIIIFLIADVLVLVAISNAAKARGRDTFSYVILSIMFTPIIIGFLLLFVLGDRPNAKLPSDDERTRLARVNMMLIVAVGVLFLIAGALIY
jgi:ABC-type transport system involved in cytochrome c biogenesis permease subunit